MSNSPMLVVPLPGGRVARVPLEALEKYVDPSAQAVHASGARDRDEQGRDEKAADYDSDPTSHHLASEKHSGENVWHTDYEYGPCSYTDEAGFPQYGYAWHHHPNSTEHAEVLR